MLRVSERQWRSLGLAVALALAAELAGCADDSGPPEADLGAGDLAPDRANRPDRGSDARRDRAADGFQPLPGLGALAGECGVLDDAEWSSTSPFLFRNAIDFGSAVFDAAKLSPGGQAILAVGNLNSGSLHSEIFAYEVLYRCELAKLLKTEKTVEYTNPNGKRTDLLTEIDGRPIGVSVTRAVHYPKTAPYTEAEATTLLESKLGDLPLSRANAKPPDTWSRSILSVVAYDAQHADAVQSAWAKLGAALKGDSILVLTVTDGEDGFIYP
ncbi:MAG: hypothetical protein ACOY3Y_04180 [Acidobacteriota bacterium]